MIHCLFLILALVGLLMNGLLVGMAIRAKHASREMLLVKVLALIDMVLPLFTMVGVLYRAIKGEDLVGNASMCNFEGAVDFIFVFLSMMLVSMIAMVRVSHVLKWKIPLGIKAGLFGFWAVFCLLCVACGVRGEYRVLEAGIYCAPVGMTSYVSMAVLVMNSASMLGFLLITVLCYARIIATLMTHQKDLVPSELIPPTHIWQARKPGLIRTFVFIISYLVIILPPSILMFLEAILPTHSSKKLNTPIDLFIVSISILNPSLVLFAHSTIFKELTIVFS